MLVLSIVLLNDKSSNVFMKNLFLSKCIFLSECIIYLCYIEVDLVSGISSICD